MTVGKFRKQRRLQQVVEEKKSKPELLVVFGSLRLSNSDGSRAYRPRQRRLSLRKYWKIYLCILIAGICMTKRAKGNTQDTLIRRERRGKLPIIVITYHTFQSVLLLADHIIYIRL